MCLWVTRFELWPPRRGGPTVAECAPRRGLNPGRLGEAALPGAFLAGKLELICGVFKVGTRRRGVQGRAAVAGLV